LSKKSVRWLTLALAVTACASLKNTPAQDLAWERWTKCRHFDMTLQEIKADGTVWARPTADGSKDYGPWQECMRQALVEQRKAKGRTSTPPAQADSTPPAANVAFTPIAGPIAAPSWKPGYEWSYRWDSPRGKGTFVWSVDRVETVEGIDYYVVKSGQRREIYWRKSDFVLLMDKVDGAVEQRQIPLTPWTMWPLTPGQAWTMHYTEERPADRQTEERKRACRVEAEEDVTVPAGAFRTVKVACNDVPTGRLAQEIWYAPQVKHWVRQRTHFNYGVQERELLNFRVD
jgi:hypothetical protein